MFPPPFLCTKPMQPTNGNSEGVPLLLAGTRNSPLTGTVDKVAPAQPETPRNVQGGRLRKIQLQPNRPESCLKPSGGEHAAGWGRSCSVAHARPGFVSAKGREAMNKGRGIVPFQCWFWRPHWSIQIPRYGPKNRRVQQYHFAWRMEAETDFSVLPQQQPLKWATHRSAAVCPRRSTRSSPKPCPALQLTTTSSRPACSNMASRKGSVHKAFGSPVMSTSTSLQSEARPQGGESELYFRAELFEEGDAMKSSKPGGAAIVS